MIEYFLEEHNINIKIGENAKDNWDILDNSLQNDIWMHLDNFSSPYVIINNSNPHKSVLNYAASLCKYHSKYSNLKKVKVIYTLVKNVKKGNKEGQAIIKGKVNKIII